MAALSNLTIFIAHGVTRLSGEVITLPLVIPKLNSPHEPLYGSRIPIPEKEKERESESDFTTSSRLTSLWERFLAFELIIRVFSDLFVFVGL